MPEAPIEPRGHPKSLLDIDREVRVAKEELDQPPQEPDGVDNSDSDVRPGAEGIVTSMAQQIIEPVIEFANNNIDEAVDNPEGKQGFFRNLLSFVKNAPGRVAEKALVTSERLLIAFNQANRAVKRFNQANRHEMRKILGKTPEDRRRKILISLSVIGLGFVCVATWGAGVIDLFKRGVDHADGSGGSGGQTEPQYDDYEFRALQAWQTFQDEGPIPGKMLDPLAINDPQTRLVTGYYPGWFCVPQRIAICEQMVGDKIDYPGRDADLPENPVLRGMQQKKIEAEQIQFFNKMQAEWDQVWWPKIKANPKLPDEIKNFYDPANRVNLRQWYRENYPISSTQNLAMLKQTVADKMFEGFLRNGKLVPANVTPNMLSYSHLMGGFVATVYLANRASLQMLMQREAGFTAATEGWQGKSGMLPGDVIEAYRQIEIISRRPDSDLIDIAPHAKIINEFYLQIEIIRQLKPGTLGRV